MINTVCTSQLLLLGKDITNTETDPRMVDKAHLGWFLTHLGGQNPVRLISKIGATQQSGTYH